MKVTIFGLAGTGTSSVGKALANELNFDFKSSGDFFREKAKEHGLSVYHYGELGKTDSKYDKEVDLEVENFGANNDNFIVESRLAWHFIPDSIKIKFYCDLDTRIERISQRDGMSFEDSKDKSLSREKSNADRYEKYYGLKDYTNDSNFDLIIDTTNTSIEDIVKKIKVFLGK